VSDGSRSSGVDALFSPKLFAKSLMVAIFILLLESLFFAWQIYLVKEAEAEAKRQERVRNIIVGAHSLMQNLYAAGDGVAKYGIKHQAIELARYEEAKGKIPQLLAAVKAALVDQPKQAVLFNEIEMQVNKGMERIAEYRKIIDVEEPEAAAKIGLEHQARMQGLLEGLVKDLMEFLEQEKALESRSPAVLKARRDESRLLLFSGLAGNILLALLVVYLFTGNISNRLKLLVENSELLQDGHPLNTLMEGRDEIAELDQGMHEMAESLRYEERMVREAEEEFRTIIEQLPVGLLIISTAGGKSAYVIDYANEQAEYIFDVQGEFIAKRNKENGLVGKQFLELFTEENVGALDFSELSRKERVLLKAKTMGEPARTISLELGLVSLKIRERDCYLAIVVDVSERIDLENMKKAFVAMVSHDLRTPLTSVVGFLQLLPAGVYGPVEERVVSEAKRSEAKADLLIGLINDLLDLEKLKAGHLEMHRAEVSLEDCLDNVIDNLSELCEERKVNIVFEGCRATVIGDSDRLVQALGKLVGCFVRLVKHGQITLLVQQGAAVSVRLLAPEKLFPPSICDLFFEPFQKIDEHKAVPPGLGLALARALLEANSASAVVRVDRSATELLVQFN
jgi:signal transduction histidine kinase